MSTIEFCAIWTALVFGFLFFIEKRYSGKLRENFDRSMAGWKESIEQNEKSQKHIEIMSDYAFKRIDIDEASKRMADLLFQDDGKVPTIELAKAAEQQRNKEIEAFFKADQ